MKKIFTAILLSAIIPFLAYAQFENNTLKTPILLDSNQVNNVYLHFTAQPFLRNTEFFNNHIVGATWFGYELSPTITYQPTKWLKFSGGVFAHKDFGNAKYTLIAPLFTMKIQSNGYGFLFGNLEGWSNHGYDEPIYDIEAQIHNYPENGAQGLIDKKYIRADMFINWVKMEYQNDSTQIASNYHEEIMAGTNDDIYLVNNKKIALSVPVQALLWHHGGQLNDLSTPVTTIGDFAEGLNLVVHTKSPVFSKIHYTGLFMQYRNMSGPNDTSQPYHNGKGVWNNLLIQSKYGFGMVFTYWYGYHWISPLGNYLYSTLSYWKPGYKTDDRRLVFVRFIYEKNPVPGFKFDLRMEPYYDLRAHMLEYSYSFYCQFTRDFKLTKHTLPSIFARN